jgi:dihydrofolate reductase
MRKLIFLNMISLDGYFEGPDGGLDWAVIDEELHRFVNDQERAIGGYLYGRKMYETMEAYWPTADQDPSNPEFIREFSQIWKSIPKTVFSKTLQQVDGNARLVRGDVAGEVARLKALPGKNLEVGGARLASTLIGLGLVDELQIYVNPVILGSGTKMTQDLVNPVHLQLVDTHPFRSGVVLHRYQIQETRKGD